MGTGGANGQPPFETAAALAAQAVALQARKRALEVLMATAAARAADDGDDGEENAKEGEEEDDGASGEEDDDEGADEGDDNDQVSAAVRALASVKRGLGVAAAGGSGAANTLRKLTKRVAPDGGH